MTKELVRRNDARVFELFIERCERDPVLKKRIQRGIQFLEQETRASHILDGRGGLRSK